MSSTAAPSAAGADDAWGMVDGAAGLGDGGAATAAGAAELLLLALHAGTWQQDTADDRADEQYVGHQAVVGTTFIAGPPLPIATRLLDIF